MLLEPGALLVSELVGVQHVDAGLGEQRLQHHPVLLLLGGELRDRVVDAVELLGGREPILAWRLDAGDDLAAQARHADHVELVEVRGGDGQEAQAFEQRMALVLGLLQHAAIELQPGQLAVEKAARPEDGRARASVERLGGFRQAHLYPLGNIRFSLLLGAPRPLGDHNP